MTRQKTTLNIEDCVDFMDIPNYEGYKINKNGVVISTVFKNDCRPAPMVVSSRIDFTGYPCVMLNAKPVRIHRLLAMCYIPNPNNYPWIDHIDRNRTNNDLANLRWVNASMNNRNRGKWYKKDAKYIHLNSYTDKKNKKTYNYYIVQYLNKDRVFIRKRFQTEQEAINFVNLCKANDNR